MSSTSRSVDSCSTTTTDTSFATLSVADGDDYYPAAGQSWDDYATELLESMMAALRERTMDLEKKYRLQRAQAMQAAVDGSLGEYLQLLPVLCSR